MKWKMMLALGCTLCFLQVDANAQWSTSGSNVYYNSGNVGIGTSSPKSKFHVTGKGTFDVIVEAGGSSARETVQNSFFAFESNTPIYVGHRAWSRTSGFLWGAYKKDTNVNGDLWEFGNTAFDDRIVQPGYDTRAGSFGFQGNSGGSFRYFISSQSAEGNDGVGVEWDEIARFRRSGDSFINTGGNLGIGTTSPTERLTIKGTAKAEEIIVTEDIGADFVFEEYYDLSDLSALEKFINANKHLPEIPTAQEMIRDGVKVGELQMKLLQKIEELTLYVIELEKRDQQKTVEILELRAEMHQLKEKIK